MKKTFLIVLLLLSCVFIFAQLNPWLWAKKAGGTGSDWGYGIAVDTSGNSYVTGYFKGTATFGSTNLTSNGGYDIFVAKLDSSGNWLWAK
ncbi:MAG TPA: SBBP repeat-containing protein, partial [Candidatus Syntrophosphaera sp.]|nr:SBBP repeat-containing protein [Candidatus Syntrophosphaera sp.]